MNALPFITHATLMPYWTADREVVRGAAKDDARAGDLHLLKWQEGRVTGGGLSLTSTHARKHCSEEQRARAHLCRPIVGQSGTGTMFVNAVPRCLPFSLRACRYTVACCVKSTLPLEYGLLSFVR